MPWKYKLKARCLEDWQRSKESVLKIAITINQKFFANALAAKKLLKLFMILPVELQNPADVIEMKAHNQNMDKLENLLEAKNTILGVAWNKDVMILNALTIKDMEGEEYLFVKNGIIPLKHSSKIWEGNPILRIPLKG